MTSIGQYNTKCYLDEMKYSSLTEDSSGGMEGGEWTQIKSTWCKVEIGKGKFYFEDGRLGDDVPCLVKMPFLQKLTENFGAENVLSQYWRIRTAHGDVIKIHSVVPSSQRRKELVIVGILERVVVKSPGDYSDDYDHPHDI